MRGSHRDLFNFLSYVGQGGADLDSILVDFIRHRLEFVRQLVLGPRQRLDNELY